MMVTQLFYLFCSSSLARSSSSSGLRFSESAGEAVGAESAASWELESGVSTGLPAKGGSVSSPGGELRSSSWTEPAIPPSLSGLLLGLDMTEEPRTGKVKQWRGDLEGYYRVLGTVDVNRPPWRRVYQDWVNLWKWGKWDYVLKGFVINWMMNEILIVAAVINELIQCLWWEGRALILSSIENVNQSFLPL